ncbi:putative aquaporin 4 [Dendrothele bispora CBS 962.96]|uniref:Putative aquaporin 4 n=1 Tax=Dendrothele bispora (strain CBS 962.96) TaxID=1314807 RepID=A0A4S8MSF5_DENBC|nr:putative aquaporin 4 [Dendrothele bispora CBS 962.96]
MDSPTDKASFSQEEHHPVQSYIRPPRWWRYRQSMREYVAEFAGVMIMIIFGDGVVCQVVLSANGGVAPAPKGEYLSISFGWAVGVAMGLWVSVGISGGHLNPAVTLALATFRGFPWKKVPGYILAQMMGGLVGGGIVYANYIHAIDIVEGGRHIRTLKTAGLFSTYALDYMTNVSCFFSEFMASAILLILVLAVTDKRNAAPPAYLLPLALFILILGIGACLGMETGYAINPARDLGPRLLTSMVGYGSQVYTFRNHYWLWCPVLGSIIGCQTGAFLYDFLLYDGPGSIFSRPPTLTEDAQANMV